MDFPKIQEPYELQNYSVEDLEILAEQCRDFILENVTKTGGHLASNLGVVELILCLAKTFDFREGKDRLIFDVGHQCYTWKMITGRAEQFRTLRQDKGLSGFPKREESPFDFYNAGHSSDSISIALGYARADRLHAEQRENVVIIGDGGLTGGVAYEALNDVAQGKEPLRIIINDNQMSIDRNLGGLSNHLEQLRISTSYLDFKERVSEHLSQGESKTKFVRNFLEGIKARLRRFIHRGSSYFEAMGLRYYGPVDGHNIPQLLQYLKAIKRSSHPTVLHVVTQKGRGYSWAVQEPVKYHGVSPFEAAEGIQPSSKSKPTFSGLIAEYLPRLGEQDPRVCAITAAMAGGTGLSGFAKKFPERFFDTAITEQHAASLAAGLALGGMRPYFAVYSTFSQRAVDQILHDVCLQNLPVCFLIDRAGLVGHDGETHQGLYDTAIFQNFPNLELFAPADARDLRDLLAYSLQVSHPMMIRYPKAEAREELAMENRGLKNLRLLRSGEDYSILVYGALAEEALAAAEKVAEDSGLEAAVYSAVYERAGLDAEGAQIAQASDFLVLIEESIAGVGFAQNYLNYLREEGIFVETEILQVKNPLRAQASRAELLKAEGLEREGIYDSILRKIRDLDMDKVRAKELV